MQIMCNHIKFKHIAWVFPFLKNLKFSRACRILRITDVKLNYDVQTVNNVTFYL